MFGAPFGACTAGAHDGREPCRVLAAIPSKAGAPTGNTLLSRAISCARAFEIPPLMPNAARVPRRMLRSIGPGPHGSASSEDELQA